MAILLREHIIKTSDGIDLACVKVTGEDTTSETYDFTSESVILTADNIAASLLEAIAYARKGESNPWIQCAHFSYCELDKNFLDAPQNTQPLAINHLKFTNRTADVFRYFFDMLVNPDVFSISNAAEHYLRMLELVGMNLESKDFEIINWLSKVIPSFRVLKLENCTISDDNMSKFICAVKDNSICWVELPGTQISLANKDALDEVLRENRKRLGQEPLTENPRYRNYLHKGQQLKIPQNGGILDLSEITIALDHLGKDVIKGPELLDALSLSSPEKISLQKTKAYSLYWDYLLGSHGLKYSEAVKEINVTGSLASDTFDRLPCDIYRLLAKLLHESFPNTEVFICDNNYLKGDVGSGSDSKYFGASLSGIVTSPGLKICSFANCHIVDPAITDSDSCLELHLTAKPAGSNLRALNLSGNPLTDKCVPKLLEWVENSNITQLVLKGTEISPVNLRKLGTAALDNAKRLGEEPMAYEFPTYFAAKEAANDHNSERITPAGIRAAVQQRRGRVNL